jgi:hypothetical protein
MWNIGVTNDHEYVPFAVIVIEFKSESVSRRTNNTMAKRKRTKGQTTIYKTLRIKVKIE